ncbi:MAG TPA: ATP-binding protein [Nitrospirota bacterium]|nr:ATP-binding protein [Nitrospirota bacterium]
MLIAKSTSIKRKLLSIGLVTSGIALLSACVVFIFHEAWSFHSSRLDELTVQADMIGSNSTVALSFNNRRDAEEILNALVAAPSIVQAVIYRKDGNLFAVYHRRGTIDLPAPLTAPSAGHSFGVNQVILVRPILLDHERIGSIYIRSDLRDIYARMFWLAGIAVLAFVLSLLLAYFLLSRLQKMITAPMLELVNLTRAVSLGKDYSLRSTEVRDDEMGSLATGLNEMLTQIQLRDEELKSQQEHLEEKVAVRTAELAMANDRLQKELEQRKRTEDQLRHSQRLEAVGRLSGGVAHDFNNILTAIIGYASLLQMKMSADDPMRHHVDEILASASRAAHLTQSLLAFSRKQVMNPKPVDITLVIERISKLLQRLIGEDVVLERKLFGEQLIAVVDSGQLEQVLMNLSTNARDAMPDGGRLTIETERHELSDQFIASHEYMKPGPYAVVTVSDTGSGMDEDTASRIFEPFFTTKDVGKGTGLGLSIVHGIIKQHEGYINVYTEPGRGTTFRMYLPLVRATVANDVIAPVQEMKKGTETILLAEDDAVIRRLTRAVLEEAGYTIIECADGQDAIDKIRQHRDSIRLLLLDMIMPKKNGKEVYEETRALLPGVKTLFVSGYTADIIQSKGLLYDGQEMISKPLSPADLLLKIRLLLDSA